MGTVTLPGTPQPIPAVDGVWPGRSIAGTESYTFAFGDPNGFAEISLVDVLINTSLDGRHACQTAPRFLRAPRRNNMTAVAGSEVPQVGC